MFDLDLLELAYLRADQVGLISGSSFDVPLTQEQLGDTMGLTSVHVNRVLQRMRSEDLIVFEQKHLTIKDMDRMRAVSSFNPRYLHLQRDSRARAPRYSPLDASSSEIRRRAVETATAPRAA